MKRIIALHLLLLTTSYIFSQNVAIFEKNGQYGLKDKNNKTVTKANFDYIHPLYGKYFLIEKNKKIGVISETGEIIFSPMYDNIQNFEDNYFIVTENKKCGILNNLQQTILPFEYTNIERLNNYLYIVSDGYKKGIINKSAQVMIPPIYDEIDNLSEILYLLKNENSVNIIDNLGGIILSGNYNSFEKLPYPNLYKVTVGNKIGIIDLNGKIFANPVLDNIDISNPDFITITKDGKFGFIINGTYIAPVYDKITYIQNEFGIIVVKQGALSGLVTTKGAVIAPMYDNISRFSPNGYAFVEKKGKLMYIDTDGKEKSLQEITGNVRF